MAKPPINSKIIEDTAIEIIEHCAITDNTTEITQADMQQAIEHIFKSMNNFYDLFYSQLTEEQQKEFEQFLQYAISEKKHKKHRMQSLKQSATVSSIINTLADVLAQTKPSKSTHIPSLKSQKDKDGKRGR